VVDCTGLENRQRATVREFESHRFRQIPTSVGFFSSQNTLQCLVIAGFLGF